MEYIYGAIGFVILISAIGWYEQRRLERQRHKEEMNTMTVKELIAKLKKCDPSEEIIVDIKYADYAIRPRDLDDPSDDFGGVDSDV